MSPKIKSVLSVALLYLVFLGVGVVAFLPKMLAFIASSIGGLILIVFLLLLIPYLLYRFFLKIYS